GEGGGGEWGDGGGGGGGRHRRCSTPQNPDHAFRGQGQESRVEVGVSKTPARSAAEEALLDAAERLLVEVGYAGITTRRLAKEAGVNHGLVHYYFGSIEDVLGRTLRVFNA